MRKYAPSRDTTKSATISSRSQTRYIRLQAAALTGSVLFGILQLLQLSTTLTVQRSRSFPHPYSPTREYTHLTLPVIRCFILSPLTAIRFIRLPGKHFFPLINNKKQSSSDYSELLFYFARDIPLFIDVQGSKAVSITFLHPSGEYLQYEICLTVSVST